jgi:hypothetical protein
VSSALTDYPFFKQTKNGISQIYNIREGLAQFQQYCFGSCKTEMNYGMFFSFFFKGKINPGSIKINLTGQAGLPFYYRKRMQYHVHPVNPV